MIKLILFWGYFLYDNCCPEAALAIPIFSKTSVQIKKTKQQIAALGLPFTCSSMIFTLTSKSDFRKTQSTRHQYKTKILTFLWVKGFTKFWTKQNKNLKLKEKTQRKKAIKEEPSVHPSASSNLVFVELAKSGPSVQMKQQSQTEAASNSAPSPSNTRLLAVRPSVRPTSYLQLL